MLQATQIGDLTWSIRAEAIVWGRRVNWSYSWCLPTPVPDVSTFDCGPDDFECFGTIVDGVTPSRLTFSGAGLAPTASYYSLMMRINSSACTSNITLFEIFHNIAWNTSHVSIALQNLLSQCLSPSFNVSDWTFTGNTMELFITPYAKV